MSDRQFHIGSKGAAPCNAQPGKCPLGGDHFDTESEAEKAYEVQMADQQDQVLSKSRDVSFRNDLEGLRSSISSQGDSPASQSLAKHISSRIDDATVPSDREKSLMRLEDVRSELHKEADEADARGDTARAEQIWAARDKVGDFLASND